MPATPGPQPGPKPKTPARGSNGPGDKGKSSGTRHYAPTLPKGGKLPIMTGTKGK